MYLFIFIYKLMCSHFSKLTTFLFSFSSAFPRSETHYGASKAHPRSAPKLLRHSLNCESSPHFHTHMTVSFHLSSKGALGMDPVPDSQAVHLRL